MFEKLVKKHVRGHFGKLVQKPRFSYTRFPLERCHLTLGGASNVKKVQLTLGS
jgi:hypothetical protein